MEPTGIVPNGYDPADTLQRMLGAEGTRAEQRVQKTGRFVRRRTSHPMFHPKRRGERPRRRCRSFLVRWISKDTRDRCGRDRPPLQERINAMIGRHKRRDTEVLGKAGQTKEGGNGRRRRTWPSVFRTTSDVDAACFVKSTRFKNLQRRAQHPGRQPHAHHGETPEMSPPSRR